MANKDNTTNTLIFLSLSLREPSTDIPIDDITPKTKQRLYIRTRKQTVQISLVSWVQIVLNHGACVMIHY